MVLAAPDIDDLLALFDTQPKEGKRLRLEALIATATEELEAELGFTFARNPTSGPRTWLVDTDGSDTLHLHRGIVSVDTLEFSSDQGATFEEIATTEYRLQSGWRDTVEPLEAEPYFHLRMLPYGTWRTLPRGTGLVRLTGATGWRGWPRAANEGIVERARQLAFADPSYSGSVPSDDAFGRPTSYARWPDVTWKFIQREKQRFMACSL